MKHEARKDESEEREARAAARRVNTMRYELRNSWVGLEKIVDWLLAALIARENALLLGPPGVAKTEIAVRIFELLGLTKAEETRDVPDGNSATNVRDWWDRRKKEEGEKDKYFHYLLSRFTQPEELFGPIEINLLRQGHLVRINFGLLTGPGVRAVFLDEVFKASSSILNTLLTLTQEREYFNWGGMVRSDIEMFVGAANELPGGLSSGNYGVGSGTEDFQTLYAFLDRFAIRLAVPMMSATSSLPPQASKLAHATRVAINRESRRFTQGAAFEPRDSNTMPTIEDVRLLGKHCLLQDAGFDGGPFREKDLKRFLLAFIDVAAALQERSTNPQLAAITWTISPRKLKALYKIALAHALICDDKFLDNDQSLVSPGEPDLHVFDLIWDSPIAQGDLAHQVRSAIGAAVSRHYR